MDSEQLFDVPCHRCGKNADYGYELNSEKTAFLGPICSICANKMLTTYYRTPDEFIKKYKKWEVGQ